MFKTSTLKENCLFNYCWGGKRRKKLTFHYFRHFAPFPKWIFLCIQRCTGGNHLLRSTTQQFKTLWSSSWSSKSLSLSSRLSSYHHHHCHSQSSSTPQTDSPSYHHCCQIISIVSERRDLLGNASPEAEEISRGRYISQCIPTRGSVRPFSQH